MEASAKSRPTELVPMTTMEEVPLLSGQERAALTKSLVDGAERIAAGDFVEYDPLAFKDQLWRSYEAAKQAKKT